MGMLLIGVVTGILISFGLAPTQASLHECSWQGCFDRAAASPPMEQKSTIAEPKRVTVTKSKKPSYARPGGRADLVKTAHVQARADAATSYRPAESSNSILSKAKISIAAKMEDPASAEFGDMKRAIRKNTLGKPVDTICGRVRGKNASGSDTGERPFLYLVKEDDAYVVTDKADSVAAIAYRNICN